MSFLYTSKAFFTYRIYISTIKKLFSVFFTKNRKGHKLISKYISCDSLITLSPTLYHLSDYKSQT